MAVSTDSSDRFRSSGDGAKPVRRRFKLGAAIVAAILTYPGVAAAQTDARPPTFCQSLTVDALVAAAATKAGSQAEATLRLRSRTVRAGASGRR
jgi:hypothetical protein